MRVLVRVQTEKNQEWKVTVTSDALQPNEISSVLLSAQEVLGVDYPVPEPTDLTSLSSALKRIKTRSPHPNDLETVGKYLFDILLGSTFDTLPANTWTIICQKADAHQPNSIIELDLLWEDENAAKVFRPLPWEIMHDGDNFLAAYPNRIVAITRLVKNPFGQNSPAPVEISPKVLFIVGSEHHDPVLRPGAEILGLIRRLETVGLDLHFVSQVRVRATKDDVEKAIRSFRPSIVHFICHGGQDQKGGYIELTSTERGVEFDQVRADELFSRLTPDEILPPLVILNACDTAKASAQEGIISLAEKLILKGVPVVLGMAGEVAESACRFVTRGFYEALLRGECPQIAVAKARKAALQAQGTNPGATVDWSLLTLFSKELLSLKLNQSEADLIKNRRLRAKDYRIISDPHLFCDRVELLATFQRLLEDRGPNVFAIQDPSMTGFKCGKTRLLEEFAAQATEYGHIPFFIHFPTVENLPKDTWALADFIFNVLCNTYRRFEEDPPVASQLDQLVCKQEYSLDPNVIKSLRGQSLSNLDDLPLNTLIIAFQVDLQSLKQTLGNSQKVNSNAKIVVLIDGLHLLQPALLLVKEWFNSKGLGDPFFTIPTAFTFSNGSNASAQSVSEEIKSYIEPRRNLFEYSALLAFPHPKTDPLPYHQLLLSHSPPLVLSTQISDEDKKAVLELLHEATENGSPISFMTHNPKTSLKVLIKSSLVHKAFVPATDDNMFLQLFGGNQNA